MGKASRNAHRTEDAGLGGAQLMDRRGSTKYWGPRLNRTTCLCGRPVLLNYTPIAPDEKLCGACTQRLVAERKAMKRRMARAVRPEHAHV